MIEWETCSICDIVGARTEIAMSLVEWKDPEGGLVFQAVVRCRDAQRCRDRYETPTRRWPIVDRTVPTLPVAVKVVSPAVAEIAG